MENVNGYTNIYLMMAPNSQIDKIYISGGRDAGFSNFMREVVTNLDSDAPIPRSYLLKFDVPKTFALDLLNRYNLEERKNLIAEKFKAGQLYPSHIVPLAKAVFCTRHDLDSLAPFNPVTERKYQLFQTQQLRRLEQERSGETRQRKPRVIIKPQEKNLGARKNARRFPKPR